MHTDNIQQEREMKESEMSGSMEHESEESSVTEKKERTGVPRTNRANSVVPCETVVPDAAPRYNTWRSQGSFNRRKGYHLKTFRCEPTNSKSGRDLERDKDNVRACVCVYVCAWVGVCV